MSRSESDRSNKQILQPGRMIVESTFLPIRSSEIRTLTASYELTDSLSYYKNFDVPIVTKIDESGGHL